MCTDEKTGKLPHAGEFLKTRKHEYEIVKLLGKGEFYSILCQLLVVEVGSVLYSL